MSEDPIQAAIDASATPAVEEHEQVTITIASTGRHVGLSFPIDMTDAELFEFVGWASTNWRNVLLARKQQLAGGRIVLPTGVRVS